MSAGLAPVVFDAYGTLFDPAALAEPLEEAFPGGGRVLAAAWRTTQLRHSWLRSLMGAYLDFDSVTSRALEQVLADAGLTAPPGLLGSLLARYRALPPYPDAVAALAALEPERPLAILTNGRRATVEATVRAAALGTRIPAVLSVEEVGVYKPAPAVYALATAHFSLPADAIWFVSGNNWDCAGAAAVGLRAIRVRRSPEGPELVGPAPVATVASLVELPSVLGTNLD
jgi:2-haloacid dehalogenase